MTGIIVEGVRAAIAFECSAEGQKHQLATDRLWMWRVCDLRLHADWQPRLNRALSNHFLHVHRENWLCGAADRLVIQAIYGYRAAGRGVPSEATAPPCRPGPGGTASNTTPESLSMRFLESQGGR